MRESEQKAAGLFKQSCAAAGFYGWPPGLFAAQD
jgi:hypothetical protein